MNRIGRISLSWAVAAALVAPGGAAFAATPAGVRDLVGVRGSSGETQLESRGYEYISGTTSDEAKIAYWWNASSKDCIMVRTVDGVYEAIRSVSASDCGKTSGKNSTATGVAVAVGAAALIGAIALAHKSHDHENGDHYGDARNEADYERGYRDGLYNQTYHNYDRSTAYSDGYSAGVRQRGQETSYRSGDYNSGGYGGFTYVNDLEGQPRDRAWSQLNNRGFVMRDNKKAEDGRYATFWREASRQCIVVHSRNGYVVTVESVPKRTCNW